MTIELGVFDSQKGEYITGVLPSIPKLLENFNKAGGGCWRFLPKVPLDQDAYTLVMNSIRARGEAAPRMETDRRKTRKRSG